MITPAAPRLRPQLLALARQELARSLVSRRAVPVLLLAGLTLLLAVLRYLFLPDRARADPGVSVSQFAQTFYFLILRFVVYFGCAWIFVNLVRGEILDRTIHYRLLVPLRREHLIVGKYLGGLAAALILFVPLTLAVLALFFLPHGGHALGTHVLSSATAAYVTTIVLACIAYGAVFTATGLVFRNPAIPAAVFLGWELLAPFLPRVLQLASVFEHLTSFSPVPLNLGTFALVREPLPAWLDAVILLLLSAALVALAARGMRSLEVTYSVD